MSTGDRLRRRGSLGHLARRARGSLSRRPPTADDEQWALSWLDPAEGDLWRQMPVADRRHSIVVARRFAAIVGVPTRVEMAGALLHDVGKIDSGLGTLGRVAATVVGPRTSRFRRYHDHERIGAEMLAAAGADPVTIALVRGVGPRAIALRQADDV